MHSQPADVQENIFNGLGTNDIINLYRARGPVSLTETATRNALRNACNIGTSEPIRIYMMWDTETFARVRKLLGNFVRKIVIVGLDYRQPTYPIMKHSDLKNFISSITGICPNITNFKMIHFHMPIFHTASISTLTQLTNIEMNYWACENCVENIDLKRENFINFFTRNSQLQTVKLSFTNESVYCNCVYIHIIPIMKDFIEQHLMQRLVNIRSFILCDEVNKTNIDICQ